jgi:carbon storage regulator CsrA
MEVRDMLVLSRRVCQKVLFPEIGTSVQVVAVKPGAVRLGIDAPKDLKVLREEVAPEMAKVKHYQPSLFRQLQDVVRNGLNSLGHNIALLRQQLAAGLLHKGQSTLDVIEEDIETLKEQVVQAPAAPAPPLHPENLRRTLKQATFPALRADSA